MILFAADIEYLTNPLALGSIAFAALSLVIVGWFLLARPNLTRETKFILLFGVAVFPIGSAMSSNLVGFNHTMSRDFCSRCHLMTPYTDDSENPASETLASRHARNELFGDHNCYNCHSQYGLYGTVMTKMGGMNHVLVYYTGAFRWRLPEAYSKIHLYKPYTNKSCTHCHSMMVPGFNAVKDHRGAIDDLKEDKTSCASEGCHGPAHPFSKPYQKLEVAQ
jgi:cytochrome c-type protein NapC